MTLPPELAQSRLDPRDEASVASAIHSLVGIVDIDVLAQRAAKSIHTITGSEFTSVAVREGPNELVMRGVYGSRTDEYVGLHVARGCGVGGRILLTGRPVMLSDYLSDSTIVSEPFFDIVVREGLHAAAGMPVIMSDSVLGVVYANARTVSRLNPRVGAVLGAFAEGLAPLLLTALQVREQIQGELEEQRCRIAGQLHNSLLQSLFVIAVAGKRLEDRLPTEDHETVAIVASMRSQVESAQRELRDFLEVAAQSDPGTEFGTAVRVEGHAFVARTGVPVSTTVIGSPLRLSALQCQTLVHCVREGLVNVERHSHASSVVLTVVYDEGHLNVTIQDDGCGMPAQFESAAVPHGRHGWGLVTLRREVEALGGGMSVASSDSGGALLRITLPVKEANDSRVAH